MNPIMGLWKDTWFVWILLASVLGFGVFYVTALFLAGFPALIVYFLYFAFVRYDEQGKKKSV